MKDSNLLKRARALVETPDKWTKGFAQRRECTATAIGEACLRALGNKEGGYRADILAEGFAVINGLMPAHSPLKASYVIIEWNDAPERTHADIVSAFDKAIAVSKANEKSL